MLHIAIVDDEIDYIDEISNIAGSFLKSKNVLFQFYKFQNTEDFLQCSISMDLVFLDIQMGGMDGISAARILRKKNKHIALIYITNFSFEIKRSFSVHPFAFMEKPIDHHELIQNLTDFLDYSKSSVSKSNVTFKSDKGEINIDVQEILYLEYIGNRKLNMVLSSHSFLIRGSVNELLKVLSPYHFISPHKSFIINAEQIEQVKIPDIIMKNKVKIPISQKSKA